MKKVILCLIALIACSGLYSQRVKLTANGLVDAANPTNTFVSFIVPNSSSMNLYKGIYNYVVEYFENPTLAINSYKENVMIKFSSTIKGATMAEIDNGYLSYDMSYDTELIVMNDSTVNMRVSNILFTPNDPENNKRNLVMIDNGQDLFIFNKKGTVVQYDAKRDIDEHFNSRIFAIKGFLEHKK